MRATTLGPRYQKEIFNTESNHKIHLKRSIESIYSRVSYFSGLFLIRRSIHEMDLFHSSTLTLTFISFLILSSQDIIQH